MILTRILPFLLLFALLGGTVHTGRAQDQRRIANTKHNLTVTGPGALRATEETQLCVFCHTPHSKVDAQPLWNHELSAADYTLYSSEYLTSLSYTAPNQPKLRSKLCLSCHDGTVALGAVYNNGGAAALLELEGGVTTMPAHAAGNLGTSLANDHPVGYIYDSGRDPELLGRSWPWRTPVRLDPDAAGGTVECHTCHEPHNNEHTSFLRVDNTNAALCTFCHQKSGWTEAAHRTSLQAYTTPGGGVTTVGEWACRSCHDAHGGEGVPFLLARSEENTCFASGCHGRQNTGAATADVQSALEKTYAHPTLSVSGRHLNPEDAARLNQSNRHAECEDCHDSHQARPGVHTPGSNAVSPALKGAPGVIPAPAPTWSQPLSFTVLSSAQQEYQICYRCHSANAFGPVPGGISSIVGPSGVRITDQAMEFNPANASAHPVTVPGLQRTGSPAPRALDARFLQAPWTAAGTQTMYCSDCHGNDDPGGPAGPHGSEARFMLKGRGTYWPEAPGGDLWSLADVARGQNNWQTDLFCANCHVLVEGRTFANNVHETSEHQDPAVKCVTCHVAVPHGSRRSRLIGYASDPAPYNYSGTGYFDRLRLIGFRKAANPRAYEEDNCATAPGCHDITIRGTYEP